MQPEVTFTTTDPLLQLPSAELLALHATCAKVAHFFGASEYLDKVFLEMEEADVLAPDGSSAELLSYALLAQVNREVSGQGRVGCSARFVTFRLPLLSAPLVYYRPMYQ